MALAMSMLGGLLPTLLISRLFFLVMKKWDGGVRKIVLANGMSLICATLIAGMGMADGGAFAATKAFGIYAVPQLFWLLVDLWRFKKKMKQVIGNNNGQIGNNEALGMKKKLGYAALILGGIVVYVFAGGIGKFVGRSAVESYNEGKVQGELAAGMAEAAEQLRAQLPMKIDNVTTLQNVLSINEMLIYHYAVSATKAEADDFGFIDKMKKQLKNNVCKQEDMAFVMKAGGKYKYVYLGNDGYTLGEFELDRRECAL